MGFLSIKNRSKISDYLHFSLFLPNIVLKIKNWKDFLLLYSEGFSGILEFRKGLRMKAENSSDASSISTSFFRKDYGEIEEHHNNIVDIGAHKGYFSLYALSSQPKSRVYSFEPVYNSFKVLKENIELNNFQNRAKVFNLACDAKTGTREINIASNATGNSFYENSTTTVNKKITINCISLQDLITKNDLKGIDLLKLDCEGAEYDILMGSSEQTLHKITEIRMEFHKDLKGKNASIEELTTFLNKNGFITKKIINKNTSTTGYAVFNKSQKYDYQ